MNIDHIPSNFDYNAREDSIYKNWEENNYFHADLDADKETYTIMMPPPNITGELHMGHALDTTLQDILTRWHRMQGYETLYLPGTDHASIATEAKVTNNLLEEEGLTKDQVGREGFLKRAWAWREDYGSRISKQLRKLGISCDWQRQRFTLDEGMNDAVTEVFCNLYEKGLIYRDYRMLNTCPNCKTSISDIEVEYVEKDTHLWHVKYPFKDREGAVEVATTRPETILGDTAVAVNPDDPRYKDIVGETVIVPLVGREVPIVADDYVDQEFGTGQVKITPAHDPNDYAIGQRHDLEFVEVIDKYGYMNENAGKYQGLDREEARTAIVKDLKAEGFLVSAEPYKHSVGTCSRCGTLVEPRVSLQWFVKMKPLAEPAIEAVKNGKIKFVPKYFEKIYFNWLENIEDWNISRQLWWGHRIPVYYCQNEDCQEMIVSREEPEKCPKCGSTDLKQDEDTLDTWFSSALWPFSTLGWPKDTADFKHFYPTNDMVTGSDLIFFWVARMIFSAIEQTGEVPFSTVFLHGMVRDENGLKMSKSLGNGVNPLDVISKYGTDALRYSVVNGTAPGNDQRFKTEQVEAGKAFVNKIWNAFRFVMMNLDEGKEPAIDESELKLEDRWILSRLNTVIQELNKNLENYELGVGLANIYEFLWDEYCDWYIEMVKPRLNDKEDSSRETAQAILIKVLKNSMQLLHPFMPFVTEEIYQYLPGHAESIMISKWPEADSSKIDKQAEENMQILFEAITKIRHLRTEHQIKPQKGISAVVISESEEIRNYFELARAYINKLAGVDDLKVVAEAPDTDEVEYISLVFSGGEVYVPAMDITNPEREKARLNKEKQDLEAELEHSENMLANENFVNKAPEPVVNKERNRNKDVKSKLKKVKARLAELNEKY